MEISKDTVYWLIALSCVDSIGLKATETLLDKFKDPEDVFRAKEAELVSAGLKPHQARKIRAFSGWKEVDRIIECCRKKEIKLISIFSDKYPDRLRHIDTAPPILYVRGGLKEDDRVAIAVVGPRVPSQYGRHLAGEFAYRLSEMGFSIVSGMARGIDTIAHREALRAGGRTIAVLGSGIDVVYPAENRALMRKIAEQGAVISEFPPGTKPERGNFPRRNRIISGLSLGVLVVEATSRSGTLITARYAVEQGRDVFAVPGKVNSPYAKGTNELIKQGAKLVTNVRDILEELSPEIRHFLKSVKRTTVPELSDDERVVLGYISEEPIHIDELTRACGLPLYRILSILTGLEIKGVVKQTEGKRFYRTQEVSEDV
jgi:DNA processing protein